MGSRSRRTRSAALGFALIAPLAAALGFGLRARLPRADCAFVNGAEPATLDPAAITAIPEGRIVRALFEGLVVRDPKTLEPRPGTAESWAVSADGRTWTFRLRANARWSDGRPVTAADFVYSFERLLDPRTAAPYAAELFRVVGARAFAQDLDERGTPKRGFDTVAIRAVDERTLEIGLAEPFPHLLGLLACPQLAPVSRTNLEDARARFPDTWQIEWLRPENLVVNGPFRLLERRANDRIRLAKNPSYWDAGAVAFETIDALAVEHLSTALNLYLTGEVAWIDQHPSDLTPRLSERADFRSAPFLGTYFYRVNVARPPFDDARVRRALALAIDRAAIVEKVTRAAERPLYACVPPGLPGWTGARMRHAASFAEDVAEARRLLAECGFGPVGMDRPEADRPTSARRPSDRSDARALPEIEIHYNTRESHRDVAEVIADSWRKNLGVRARLRNEEWRVFMDSQRRGDYEISRSSWIADYADPAGFLEIFTSASENNRTGWKSAEFDELVAQARRALEPERTELLARAEALLLEELPILPIYAYATRNLVAPNLEGFHENALDEHPLKYWRWARPPREPERAGGP